MRFLVTGSSGLIGSEAVRHFASRGHRIFGIDNNLRRFFFGENLLHELNEALGPPFWPTIGSIYESGSLIIHNN